LIKTKTFKIKRSISRAHVSSSISVSMIKTKKLTGLPTERKMLRNVLKMP